MKKNYVKPEFEVLQFTAESMLATSKPEIPETDQPVIPFTNERKGGWNQEQWTEN